MKIGFFDSGLGGLSILKAVREHLPRYDYAFYGDTANLPYGEKTEEELFSLTYAGIQKLFEMGATLVIVACNSASAETVRRIQDTVLKEKHSGQKVLGVIIPTIEVLKETQAHTALLIGTKRTIQSRKYERELAKCRANIRLISVATPELVPLIESGDLAQASTIVNKIIDSVKGEIDTVVLGCTHYALLKGALRMHYPFAIISQDEIIPKKLEEYLVRHPEIILSQEETLEVILSKGSYDNFRTGLT